jgi:hypothetical protein
MGKDPKTEARKPKAFPVGMRVKVHSENATGKVVNVPDFERRVDKLDSGKQDSYPIGDLSEIA